MDRGTRFHVAHQLGNRHRQRDLECLEAIALLPGTCCVASTSAAGHGLAQCSAVDRNREEQLGGKCARGAENCAGARKRSGHAGIS